MQHESIPPEDNTDRNGDELFVDTIMGQVLADINCDPDCISEEHQLLRYMHENAQKVSYFDIIASALKKVTITTVDNADTHEWRVISGGTSGIIVRDIYSERLTLIRGTLYTLPLERFAMKDIIAVLDTCFTYDASVQLTIEDFRSDMPVIACKSVVGQFGYLATSNILPSTSSGKGRVSSRIDLTRAPIQSIQVDDI